MILTCSSSFRKLAGMGCSSSFILEPAEWPATEGGRVGGRRRIICKMYTCTVDAVDLYTCTWVYMYTCIYMYM